MNGLQSLSDALCDLLNRVEGTDVQLIIGGGFGIYLKARHVGQDVRTLIDREFWPEARSTNDLDLFLRPELLIASDKLKPLARAIESLGYRPVPGAEKYQFIKPSLQGTQAGSLKIDLLTGARSSFTGWGLRVDERRVRPRPSVGLHAHPVEEAPTLDRKLVATTVSGRLSSGERWEGEVFLPHPFTFATMKLFAFRDRRDDPSKDKGSYHALDLYSVLAAITEEEWRGGLALQNEFQRHPLVIEAGKLVRSYFVLPNDLGMIRLRESGYFHEDFKLDEFASALGQLFAG
ncbi:MAG: hypothetical protein JO015_02375 [Verrucomicrobia bacterium]|nr:hypothetical protein [Verrucomicrobiota bacterium]